MKKLSGSKYKLIFDNKLELTLYEEVIVNNVLLIGKYIDNDLMDKIKIDNQRATIYNQSLSYIEVRRRSEEEIRSYLIKKGYNNQEIEECIVRLKKDDLINDYDFTIAYINDKLNMSNDGVNKIRKNLINFNISENIIDEVLSKVDFANQDEKIDKLINKQMRLNSKYTGNMLKNKILNYMINLGYDRDIIIEKIENMDFNSKSDINKEYQKLYKKYSNKYSGYKLDMTIKQKLYQKGYSEEDINKIV
jgi:regulatory protein